MIDNVTKKRIVVTGMGFLNDRCAGKGDFVRFVSDRTPRLPLEKVDFSSYIDVSLVRRADYISRCALTAARFALEDAGLFAVCNEKNDRIGVIAGTVHGALHYTVEYHASLVLADPKLASPLLFSDSVPNAVVSHISTAFGIRGYTTTVSGYCSVTQALQLGVELIQQGMIDICLVGGADVNHDFLTKAYIECLRDPGAITDSFAGSGFIVLESLAHALERKTKIYAQIEGVTVITAAYIAAKHYDVSVLNELACRSKIELGEHDVLLYMSYEEEDCLRRKDLFLQPFKGVKFDCSSSFEYDFSAGEAFQIILGILGVYCLYPLSIFKTLTAIEEPINRLFVMRTALAGANACALFSRYSLSKD